MKRSKSSRNSKPLYRERRRRSGSSKGKPSETMLQELIFALWMIISIVFLIIFFNINQPYAAYGVITAIVYYSFIWICCSGDLHHEHGFKIVALFGFLLLIPQFLGFWFLYARDRESNASFGESPCGKSSCSSKVGVDVTDTYNPNGWPSQTPPFMYCPHSHCRWADVNGESIIGYDEIPDATIDEDNINYTLPCTEGDESCAHLATQLKADYLDPGKGIPGGWFRGVTTLETDFCPGVDPFKAHPVTSILGYGKHVCAVCSNYMYKNYKALFPVIAASTCSQDEDNYWCELCVPFSLYQTQHDRWLSWVLYVTHICTCILLILGRGMMVNRKVMDEYNREYQEERVEGETFSELDVEKQYHK